MVCSDVVHKLRQGREVLPEAYDSATIMFSDIVGFVEFVSSSSAIDVMSFLNDAHGLFDKTISSYNRVQAHFCNYACACCMCIERAEPQQQLAHSTHTACEIIEFRCTLFL